jgi:hypothetical protein
MAAEPEVPVDRTRLERYAACSRDEAARIAFLEDRLDGNAPYARRWWWTWNVVYVGGMAYEGTQAALPDEREKRAAGIANAVKSAIGLTRALVARPTAMRGMEDMDAEIENAEQCGERLALAEERLRESAREAEDERWGWVTHLGNFGLNAAAAITVAELYDYDEAYWRGALGFGIGEIRLWSYPWHAESDWESYQREFGERSVKTTEASWTLEPSLHGVRLVVRF